MAQMHDEAYHAGMQGSALPLRTAAVMNWTGAALSVALVVGVSLWSYRLMVRDVSGVPVIQALEGPMRVSPDDPGGRRTAHQGLAVNVVAAQGQAAPASDAVVLAPPPVELAPEDRMAVRLGDPSDPQAALLAAVRSVPESSLQATAGTEPEAAPDAAAEGAGRLPAVIPTRSPVPPRRPGGLRARPAVAASGDGVVRTAALSGGADTTAEAVLQDIATRIATSSVTEIDPASLVPGTRLVQFGAYDDEPTARARWDALQERFPAQLEGRGRIIEEAAAGGSTFYRLRAHGFSDEPDARRFCAVFQHERVDCVPVLVR
ncbi:MAG: SPOR domain-containing protein [Pararhodobacter sp.]